MTARAQSPRPPSGEEAAPKAVFDPDTAMSVYRIMYLARQFEEQLGAIFADGKLAGWFHSCVGHEATGAALSTLLRDEDHLVPYHRSRASLLAKGMTVREIALEMMGRHASQSRGRGGDGHIVHPGRRIYGMSGVLGASTPIASGVAYAAKLRGTEEVVLNGFGEGTSNRGAVYEGLNLAAIWELPVVFICENNFYAEFTPIREVMRSETVAARVAGLGIPSRVVDGNDPEAVQPVVAQAFERARAGEGPTFIEAQTYRLKGHYEGDPQGYRDREEIAEWTARDPLSMFRARLLADGRGEADAVNELESHAAAEVSEAMEYSLAQRLPVAAELLDDVYAGDGEG